MPGGPGRHPAPLLIWNAPSITRIPDDYQQDEATVHSTTVGAVMYGNVLVREGRTVPVVTAAHGDEVAIANLLRSVRAVAVAGSLRDSTFLRIGEPIAGYLDVEASAAELARLGVREVALTRAEWEALVESVEDAAADALAAEVTTRWHGDPGAGASTAPAWRWRSDLRSTGPAPSRAPSTATAPGSGQRRGGTAGLPRRGLPDRRRPTHRLHRRPDHGHRPGAGAAIAGAALYCETYAPETRDRPGAGRGRRRR